MITAMRLDIEQLKRDKHLLLSELGIEREGGHCKCPFHEDRTGSLNVNKLNNGVWLARCGAGCVAGSIIDVRKLKGGYRTDKEAIESLAKDLGMKIHVGPPKPKPPVIKIDEATAFIQAAQKNLEDFDTFETWALDKRGIKNLETVKRLGLGFVENHKVYGGNWTVTGWVIPITDEKGKTLCVKFHKETGIHRERHRSKEIPKCFWLPFGKKQQGKDKAEHGFKTIFPAPEMFGEVEDYFFHPGELKAAVAVDHGYAAGSPTSGEGGVIHPEDIRRIKAKRIWICYDDETGKEKPDGSGVRNAGAEWRDAHLKAFMLAGFEDVRAITYGDLESEELKKNYDEQETTEEAQNQESSYGVLSGYERSSIQTNDREPQRNNRGEEEANQDLQGGRATSVTAMQAAMQAAFTQAVESERMEVIAAVDLDAMQKAFENSTLIKVPERNPLASPGMTESYYKKFNEVCSDSEYVKPFISAADLDMLSWMKSAHGLDYSRRVHPHWIERQKINAESYEQNRKVKIS